MIVFLKWLVFVLQILQCNLGFGLASYCYLEMVKLTWNNNFHLPFVIMFFREVFNLMDAMKVDMANFQLQSIKPHLVQQPIEYERNKFKDYLWPYLGKPGLTKTPLNRFSISTHFGNVRMHYRSFSMHLKTLTTFANENEMHWRSFWIHFESFAPRFKTFTMHFSEAVSRWKTFTKVQTTQQNTRTLNMSAKSMNMHCVLIEQQML